MCHTATDDEAAMPMGPLQDEPNRPMGLGYRPQAEDEPRPIAQLAQYAVYCQKSMTANVRLIT